MQDRRPLGIRLDHSVVEAARIRAGLPEGTSIAATCRYALAVLAGVDPGPQLDQTPGRGAASYRHRLTRDVANRAHLR